MTNPYDPTRHYLVGPLALWKMKRDFQIDFLKLSGLLPHHHLLDIGCGTLRGGIPLIEYLDSSHYYGIERREAVLEEGRNELREAGLQHREPVLLATDNLDSVNLEIRFPYIWAFSVLIHMNDEILNSCLRMAANHLRWDGCFYANINIGDKTGGNWQGFPVVSRSLDFYFATASANNLVVEDLGSLRSFGHRSGDYAQDEQRMLRYYLKDN